MRRVMTPEPDMTQAPFLALTVHKRDLFSETVSGHLEGREDFPVVLRCLDGVPFYARPVARALARRESRALRAVQGIDGCPLLLRASKTGLLRSWTKGTPLHLARPARPEWYRDARRLLRDMRRAGVTHNDIAKPQNWLVTPDGRAAVIDFQLASVHWRRGRLFRIMAREDIAVAALEDRRAEPGRQALGGCAGPAADQIMAEFVDDHDNAQHEDQAEDKERALRKQTIQIHSSSTPGRFAKQVCRQAPSGLIEIGHLFQRIADHAGKTRVCITLKHLADDPTYVEKSALARDKSSHGCFISAI